ncbi:MAG: hypothetical protein TREMPRED_002945 [Tremellales sp. Tagirdzhanova-0007]|nr:MAG: hypothetical protein TREMPRED_002945 [Tremellales sp. Tagirdzhanova-0007]
MSDGAAKRPKSINGWERRTPEWRRHQKKKSSSSKAPDPFIASIADLPVSSTEAVEAEIPQQPEEPADEPPPPSAIAPVELDEIAAEVDEKPLPVETTSTATQTEPDLTATQPDTTTATSDNLSALLLPSYIAATYNIIRDVDKKDTANKISIRVTYSAKAISAHEKATQILDSFEKHWKSSYAGLKSLSESSALAYDSDPELGKQGLTTSTADLAREKSIWMVDVLTRQVIGHETIFASKLGSTLQIPDGYMTVLSPKTYEGYKSVPGEVEREGSFPISFTRPPTAQPDTTVKPKNDFGTRIFPRLKMPGGFLQSRENEESEK